MLKKITLSILFLFSTHASSASRDPVEGNHFMVVSGQHYATEVGYDILKQGGNAIDAAVAIGYALAVVHPCCGNLGGGGFMLIRFNNDKSVFINFREKAPAKSKPSLYLDQNGHVLFENLSVGHVKGTLKNPYLAVGIPGTVMGLNYALKKYGTLPLSHVMQPAINLAKKGFILMPGDVVILKTAEAAFKTQPNVGAIFLKKGQSYAVGNKLVQKELAATLTEIAKKGTRAFYEGRIAAEIVSASNRNGGLITKNDLKKYSVDEYAPLICNYKGYQILTTPPPGSGTTLCEALKIVEPYSLETLGFHSATSTHYLTEAMRFSYADRNQHLGDPNFVHNPVDELLSLNHIRKIRQQIRANRATPSNQIRLDSSFEGGNTTSYVVVDQKGNAVSVTYTLNDYFGAKVIPGHTGFFLNNEMADFTIKPGSPNKFNLYQGAKNLMQGNKRPLSSMAPTIITKNNALYMVVGTPGGSTIPSQLINVIVNVIDYGMNIQEAEDAPRFHMQWLPDAIFMERFAFSKDTQKILERMGYQFRLGSPYGTPVWGAVSGIVVDPRTHKLYGAIDSRRQSGSAMGGL